MLVVALMLDDRPYVGRVGQTHGDLAHDMGMPIPRDCIEGFWDCELGEFLTREQAALWLRRGNRLQSGEL